MMPLNGFPNFLQEDFWRMSEEKPAFRVSDALTPYNGVAPFFPL
jgi:hypothetical protein